MSNRSQSSADRSKRLSEGRCPVHGIWMSQTDGWYEQADGKDYTIVGCPRRDCNITAKAFSFDGPWELFPDLEYLLEGERPA